MGIFHWKGEKPCLAPTGRTEIPSFPLPCNIHGSFFNSQSTSGRNSRLNPAPARSGEQKSQGYKAFFVRKTSNNPG